MGKRLVYLVLFSFVFASSAIAEDAKPEDGESETHERERFVPLLGESALYLNARATREVRIASAGLDFALDTNKYVNPCFFLEYYWASFRNLKLRDRFELSEIWFGGGIKLEPIPHWLCLSAMVGTHWAVPPDDHLSRKIFGREVSKASRPHGILYHFVLELNHPEKYFRIHCEADYNDYLESKHNFQIFHGRVDVPLWKLNGTRLEVGVQANYFTDSELKYQEWDVIPTIGLENSFGKDLTIGMDVGVGYADEKNAGFRQGRHRGSVVLMVTLFGIYW